MKNLITRSITGILFVAVILGAIWYSQESFRGLIAGILPTCQRKHKPVDTLQRHSRRYLFGRNTIPYPQSAKRAACHLHIHSLSYLSALLVHYTALPQRRKSDCIVGTLVSRTGIYCIAIGIAQLHRLSASRHRISADALQCPLGHCLFLFYMDKRYRSIYCRLHHRKTPSLRTYFAEKIMGRIFRRTRFLLTLRMGMVDTMFFPQYGTMDRIECCCIDFLDMGRPLRITTETNTECQRFR